MKKSLALFLCFAFLLSAVFSSCDKKETPVLSDQAPQSSDTPEGSPAPEEIDTRIDSYREALMLLEAGELEAAYDIFLTIKDFRNVSDYLIGFSFEPETKFQKSLYYGFALNMEYDEYGRLIEQSHFSSKGDSLVYLRYEYDEKGHLVKEEYEYVSHYKDVTTYEYDEKGNLVRSNYPNGDFMTAEYNEAGNIISTSRYYCIHKEDAEDEYKLSLSEEYEYDSEGRVSKRRAFVGGMENICIYEYDTDGNLEKEVCETNYNSGYVSKSEYDESGNLIKRSSYSGDSTVPHTVWSWEYGEDGKLIKEACERDESLFVNRYEYDTFGNRIKSTYLIDDEIKSITNMEYDKYGNLTKESSEYPYSPEDNSIYSYYGYRLYYNPLPKSELPEPFAAKG